MPVKRQNHGRQKMNRGAVNDLQCDQCGRIVGKDKAISRSSRSPLVDHAAMDDLRAASIFEEPEVPTLYNTENHCVSCAVHLRIVRSHCVIHRKERFTPRTRAGSE